MKTSDIKNINQRGTAVPGKTYVDEETGRIYIGETTGRLLLKKEENQTELSFDDSNTIDFSERTADVKQMNLADVLAFAAAN